MIPTIEVDAAQALARFSPSGIPDAVRRSLRSVIPNLARNLAALVNSKLDSGLQSRRRVGVTEEMIENPTALYGKVQAVWTGDKSKSFVPTILESGARPHTIAAVNAKSLAFLWPKVGPGMFFFKSVQHPGFPGIFYMRDSFAEQRDTIRDAMREAVVQGLQETQ